MLARDLVRALFVLWLVVGVPLRGLRGHRKFKAASPSERPRFYLKLIAQQAGLTAAALVVGASVHSPWRAYFGFETSVVMVAAMCALVIAPMAFAGVRAKIAEAAKIVDNAVLPRNSRERRIFVVISLGAGLSEELAYRGFAFELMHAWPPALAVAVSALGFGVAHAFQGIRGIIATGVLGAMFGGIYWSTGNLWFAIAFHAAVDLRLALVKLD